jgi:hypothetical protein
MIVGFSYMANYGNNRMYKIDRILYDQTPASPFPDGKFATYAEYFKK